MSRIDAQLAAYHQSQAAKRGDPAAQLAVYVDKLRRQRRERAGVTREMTSMERLGNDPLLYSDSRSGKVIFPDPLRRQPSVQDHLVAMERASGRRRR